MTIVKISTLYVEGEAQLAHSPLLQYNALDYCRRKKYSLLRIYQVNYIHSYSNRKISFFNRLIIFFSKRDM